MDYFERITHLLSGILNWIAACSIVAMMILTCADVILRLFNRPIEGTYEIVSFLGAVTISFALAKTTFDQGHIAVKILMSRLPPPTRAFITLITRILTTGLFALISWQSAVFATDLWRNAEVSPTIALPFYPIVYGIALSSAVVCLVSLIDIPKLVAKPSNP
jgi:TRAP-type C4-dicarboxylate transport system permease small subunit